MLWFTADAIWFSFLHNDAQGEGDRLGKFPPLKSLNTIFHWKLSFVRSNPQAALVAESPLSPRFNHFIGNNPSRWVTNVPAYSRLVYRELYPALDLEIEFGTHGFEWSFVVNGSVRQQARRRPSIALEGLEAVELHGDKVTLHTPAGQMNLPLPRSPEGLEIGWAPLVGGEQTAIVQSVEPDKSKTERNVLRIADFYNIGQAIFDPRIAFGQDYSSEIVFSTYLGGSGLDIGRAITLTSDGEAMLTGNTTSADFTTTSTALYRSARGSEDVFVAKLNSRGDLLSYNTYFGGSGLDHGYGIALGNDPRPYLVGQTESEALLLSPTPVDQTFQGNSEAFLLMLSTGFFPTPTPSLTMSPTQSPTVTRTSTPTKTVTLTPTPSSTRSVTPTRTETPTQTLIPTRTASPTRTLTPTRT